MRGDYPYRAMPDKNTSLAPGDRCASAVTRELRRWPDGRDYANVITVAFPKRFSVFRTSPGDNFRARGRLCVTYARFAFDRSYLGHSVDGWEEGGDRERRYAVEPSFTVAHNVRIMYVHFISVYSDLRLLSPRTK